MAGKNTGGSWEDLARRWHIDPKPAEPRLEAAGERVAQILGPRGEVLKVVRPERVPFGFHANEDR